MEHLKPYILDYLSKLKPEGDTRKNIEKALLSKKQITKGESAEPALLALLASKEVFDHPPASAKGGPLYSIVSPQEYVTQKALGLISKDKKPLTSAQLKTKLKRYGNYVDEALSRLIGEGKLYLFRIGSKDLLFVQKPRPSEALSASNKMALKKILDAININKKTAISTSALLDFLDGDIRSGGEIKINGAVDHKELESLFKQWYMEDIHLMRGSKALPIPYTWKRYENWAKSNGLSSDLSVFHDLLLRMQKEGLIGLIHHDKPSTIPDNEKGCLFKTSEGFTIYYWSLYV